MATFRSVEQDATLRLPPAVLTVPVVAFSPEWEDRPREEVCLGLRPVPARDLEDARKAAADTATALYPQATDGEPFFSLWVDHYQDMLVRSIVARGTCDANDVSEPWEGWREDSDDLARMYLTTEGAQFIFDGWERMRLANDVTVRPATDDDIDALIEHFSAIDSLPRVRAIRVRRLLSFCLSELRT